MHDFWKKHSELVLGILMYAAMIAGCIGVPMLLGKVHDWLSPPRAPIEASYLLIPPDGEVVYVEYVQPEDYVQADKKQLVIIDRAEHSYYAGQHRWKKIKVKPSEPVPVE